MTFAAINKKTIIPNMLLSSGMIIICSVKYLLQLFGMCHILDVLLSIILTVSIVYMLDYNGNCEIEAAYKTYKKPKMKIGTNYKSLGAFKTDCMVSLLIIPILASYSFFIFNTLELYGFINFKIFILVSFCNLVFLSALSDAIEFKKHENIINKCEFLQYYYKDSPILCSYARDDNGNIESLLIYDKDKTPKWQINHFDYENNKNKLSMLIRNRIGYYQKQGNQDEIEKLKKIAHENNIKKEDIDIMSWKKIKSDLKALKGGFVAYFFNIETALTICEELKKEGIEDASLYFSIAGGYYYKNIYVNALKYINKAIELDKEDGDYLIRKGEILFSLKKEEEALSELLKAENMTKMSVDNFVMISMIYSNNKQGRESFEYAQKALKKNKNSGDALYAMGRALKLIGQAQEAYEYFKKAEKKGVSYTGLERCLNSLRYIQDALSSKSQHFLD